MTQFKKRKIHLSFAKMITSQQHQAQYYLAFV